MSVFIPYCVSFFMFLITFFLGKLKKKHDLLDILWGLSFIVPVFISLISNKNFNIVNIIITILISIWGFRLTYHIFIRNLKSKEDFRYQKYREEYKGKHFDLYFFLRMYMVQYIFSVIISFQAVYANIKGISDFTYLSFIGIIIWIIGYIFESVGDRQLKIFKSDKKNKGKLMTTGLWKYTRHPNYFGEATMWWGIYCIVISNYQNFFFIFSPLLITILVRYVSGVPLLEKKYDNRENWDQKENWEQYKKETSIFIPMIKRK